MNGSFWINLVVSQYFQWESLLPLSPRTPTPFLFIEGGKKGDNLVSISVYGIPADQMLIEYADQ